MLPLLFLYHLTVIYPENMKKLQFSFFLIIILLSCTEGNEIVLDEKTSFNIPEGCKEVEKTLTDIEIYKSFFENKDSNPMVLYKLLAGSDYLIFIGIGYETSYEEIKNEIIIKSANRIISEEYIRDKSFTININRDSLSEITHCLRVLNSGNKYLFSVLNNQKTKNLIPAKQIIENNIRIK